MKSYLVEVRYGIALAFATLVWLGLEYAVGLHTTRIEYHSILSNFFGVIPIALMWHAIKHRRDVLEGGSLLWWQGLMSGMVISMVDAALAAPVMWIFTKFINTGFYDAMIEHAVKTGMKRELAEVNFNPTVFAFQATLMPIIAGIFTSAILTWIARRKNTTAAAAT